MWKLKCCVIFVLGVFMNGGVARCFFDAQSEEDVGIIGGDEVDIRQFPYQVSLVLLGTHYCGGSIISDEYVLTAAHCVFLRNPEDYQVRVGSTDKLGGVLYDVEDIVYHPKFGTSVDNDIAVVKVSGKIKINGDTVDIVKLAEKGSELRTGDLVTVSGWGDTTGNADYSDVLKALTMPVFDKKHCRDVWKKTFGIPVTDHMVCAGFKDPGQSACHGDSGGPLVDKNLVQYGIVSFGEPSCHGYDLPNVYSSVASLRDWIREKTGVASYVSVLTIVAFSLERYLAICHPLHLYAMAGLRRALRIVAALWALSLLAASPFAMYTTVSYHDYPPGSGNASVESAFCAMLELPSWYLCELSSLLFFILPGIIILCLYVRMGLRIRSTHTNKPGSPGTLNGVNGSVHGEARQAQSRKAIIRMLAAVVVAFFVCWAPFHFQRLFFIYGAGSVHYHTINKHLFSVAGAFYYVSATVNPILYNVMSHRYRIAFRETLCCGHVHRKQSKYYREHSSIRETTVNHTSEGTHLVRVRSQSHDRRNRVEHKAFRRSSYYGTETTALCDKWKQDYYKDGIKRGSLMRAERNSSNSSPCNNNESSQVLFSEKEFERDYKDHEDDDSININISIHLHK